MNRPLIKICGIRDADTATFAVKSGADYVGLIFHPASPRHVNIADATKIAAAVRKAHAIPVAVFVDQDAADMLAICEITGIQTVQLHGNTARNDHHLLPAHYQRFYVQTEMQNLTDSLDALNRERDFILIDPPKTGTKKTIDWQTFHYSLPFRWFLAGGLTPKNVKQAIALLKPDGVDVASGVELSPGKKDLTLIKQFIKAAGDNHAT